MEKYPGRSFLLTTRFAALLGRIVLRGGGRWAAGALHDFCWLYPTLTRNSTWHGPVITEFETDKREVWLTIDDGPHPIHTPAMLDLLRQHDAKATFFVIGRQVDRHRDLVRRMVEEGHEVANHSYSHPISTWWALPRSMVAREMERGEHAIRVACGQSPRFFRAPVGMVSSAVHPVAQALGLTVVGWSVSAADGCCVVPSRVAARVMENVAPGSIILMHEGGASRHRPLALRHILEGLTEQGYRCVIPSVDVLK